MLAACASLGATLLLPSPPPLPPTPTPRPLQGLQAAAGVVCPSVRPLGAGNFCEGTLVTVFSLNTQHVAAGLAWWIDTGVRTERAEQLDTGVGTERAEQLDTGSERSALNSLTLGSERSALNSLTLGQNGAR